ASPWRSHLKWPPSPAINPVLLGRTGSEAAPDLMALYNTTNLSQQGQGETVAILGTGGAPDPSRDVGAYPTFYGHAGLAAGQYRQVFVGGPNRDEASLAQQELLENLLDSEMVLALAPQANVVHVFTATNAPGLFTDGIAYIVNELPAAHAVTVSYGGCER